MYDTSSTNLCTCTSNPDFFMVLTEEFVYNAASAMFHRPLGDSKSVRERRFRGLFGVSPLVIVHLWTLLFPVIPKSAEPRHVLWGLLFLKSYANEVVLSAITGADEKTQRHWIWTITTAIANLSIVSTVYIYIFMSDLV